MLKTPTKDRIESALLKLDRNKVITLLEPLGNQEATKGFADDIESLLAIDCHSFSKIESNRKQHETLIKILKKTNSLLDLLKEIRFDERFDINSTNLETAILIANQAVSIRGKNKSKATPYEPVPFNYPAALIDSLQEMRDSVALASEGVKQKRGNSEQRYPEIVIKRVLTFMFVQHYFNRFKKIPPISEKGAAHQVLIRLFYAANMSGECFLHHLREAIESFKGTPNSKASTLGWHDCSKVSVRPVPSVKTVSVS